MNGLAQQGDQSRGGEDGLQNPASRMTSGSRPGNISAEHFVAFLRRFVEYLKTRLRATQVEQDFAAFLSHLSQSAAIDARR